MNAATRRLGRGLGSLIAGGGQASVDQDETPIPHEVENEETVQHSSDSGFESLHPSGEPSVPNSAKFTATSQSPRLPV